MGDAKSGPVRLPFNPQLRLEFRGLTVTSDAGLLLPRESDERLGLSALIDQHLSDPHTSRNPSSSATSSELAAAAGQDRRARPPTYTVLHPPAGRGSLDMESLAADCRVRRTTRVAADGIGGRPLLGASLATRAGVSLRRGGSVGKPAELAQPTALMPRGWRL